MIEYVDLKDWSGYTVIDPCAGIGNILDRAHQLHPEANYIGIEIDPEVFQELKERCGDYATLINDNFENVVIDNLNNIIVIMNPPYQSGNKSIYLEWVEYIINKLNPERLSIIIPSRWLYGTY